MSLTFDKHGDVDVRPIADAIAPLLGGRVDHRTNQDGETSAWRTKIVVGADVLYLRRKHAGAAQRLTVSIGYNDIPASVGSKFTNFRTKEATFAAATPPEKLAAGIKRRVIDPSQEALAENRKRAREVIERGSMLKAEVVKLRAQFGDKIRVKDEGDTNASIYGTAATSHFNARLYASGEISFDRLGTLSAEKSRRILDILCESTCA